MRCKQCGDRFNVKASESMSHPRGRLCVAQQALPFSIFFSDKGRFLARRWIAGGDWMGHGIDRVQDRSHDTSLCEERGGSHLRTRRREREV